MKREQENFVSRRAELPIAAAALTSAAVIPAVVSAAENPDAALLDLIDGCNEAMDRSDAQAAVYSAAEDRYERAPMPAAMFVPAETDTFPTYIMRKHWRVGDGGSRTLRFAMKMKPPESISGCAARRQAGRSRPRRRGSGRLG